MESEPVAILGRRIRPLVEDARAPLATSARAADEALVADYR
jgi:hypothetical protein